MLDFKFNIFKLSRTLNYFQMCAYEPVHKKTGLNKKELQILFSMAQFPEKKVTIGGIFEQTGFNKGQISVCVANLVKEGYLDEKVDKSSRFSSYSISKKGQKIVDILEKNTAYGRKKLMKGFTKKDIETFRTYFDRILENAEKMKGKIKFEDE